MGGAAPAWQNVFRKSGVPPRRRSGAKEFHRKQYVVNPFEQEGLRTT